MIGVNVWLVYLAPQNIPSAIVLTLGNKTVLFCCCTWHDYDLTHKATPQKHWCFAAVWFVAVACDLCLQRPSGTTPANNTEQRKNKNRKPMKHPPETQQRWRTRHRWRSSRHQPWWWRWGWQWWAARWLASPQTSWSDPWCRSLQSEKELGQLCCLKKEQRHLMIYAAWKRTGKLCCLKKNWDNYAVWKKNWDNYAVCKRTGTIMLSEKRTDIYAAWKRTGTITLPEKEVGQLWCLEKRNWDNYAAWKRTGMIMLI